MSRAGTTIRRRLLATAIATLAVGLGASLVVANVLLDHRVGVETSDALRASAEAQLSALEVTTAGVRLRETPDDAVLDRRGWVLVGDRVLERPPDAAPALDRLAVRLGRGRRARDVDGPADLRLRVTPIRDTSGRVVGAVVVAHDTESLERLQQSVLLGSLVLFALVLAAGGLAIHSAVNGALRPVAQMTDAARSWSATDLDHRFDLGPARDELTGLAATLDGLLARIAASRRHEQRFAGEVAHELRTPLAGLRGRAELALQAGGADAEREHREALEAVVAQADRLSAAIDTLLAIARQELDPTAGRVDLPAIVAELDGVELIPPPDDLPFAEGDPDVVRRALAPLVDNARRHAHRAVRIALAADVRTVRIAVHDDGPGFPAELADRAFEPGVRGRDGGAGLGLALARRLARSCGGDVVLEPVDRGACVVLELPVLQWRA